MNTYDFHVDEAGGISNVTLHEGNWDWFYADHVLFKPLAENIYITKNPLIMHECPRKSVLWRDNTIRSTYKTTDIASAHMYDMMGIPRPPMCNP